MGKRNPPAKWVLPEVVHPDTMRCMMVPVPNDRMYIAAFQGALLSLASAYKWADDSAHTAKEVASVWREIIDNLDWGCEAMPFDVRQNTLNPCTLEKTEDGVLWTQWANLQKCPPNIRINDGIIEWQDPVTGIWEPVQNGDEREDGTAPPPWPDPPIGESGACLAAENIAAVYQSGLTEIKAGLTIGRDVLAITAGVTGIMAIFIPQGIVATIAQSIVLIAVQGGVSFVDSLLAHVGDLKCSVRCKIESDGSVTASDFDSILIDVETWASGLEREIVQSWLNGFGSVGLTRQGRAAGITTGDCDDCDCLWTHTFFFKDDGEQGWEAFTASGQTTPVLVNGTGWYKPSNSLGQGVSQACIIKFTFDSSINVTGASITATLSGGADADSHNLAIGGGASATSPVPYYPAVEAGVSGQYTQVHSFDNNFTIIQVHAYINCPPAGYATGGIAIESVTLQGTGTEPNWP